MKTSRYDFHRMPEGDSRSNRLGINTNPRILDSLNEDRSPWHETPEDFFDAIRRSWVRRRKLQWVRAQMRIWLSEVEQRSVALYYWHGLNYRQAAAILGMQPSTVNRAVKRAIKKLRIAAEESEWAHELPKK